MHQRNEMLTIIPSNSVTSEVTSPTSPSIMNSLQSGQFSALTFGGYPGTGTSYLQNVLNGISLNALPTALGGYVLAGLPGSCRFAANGTTYSNVNGLNVITSTSCTVPGCVTGHLGGLAINGVALAPPTALTSPEVYGLPSATKSVTSSDSSNSGHTSPAPLSPAQSMELVWHGEFDRLFSQYFPHMWCLVPTFYPPGDTWRIFKDSAKVRFSCQECGHGWTSMKGRVIFWFELNFATNAGCVMFKLYGQQCQKCKTGKFEHAMWYPEEVVKVIGNVYNRVGQIYYGFVRPPLRIDRRIGKPRNQHNAELCQACKEGLCKEEWSFS